MKTALQPGSVALYAQLAGILRDRIMSATLRSGDEIPTLEDLVAEFSVARVTARQAVQLLVGEGLLSSQRGRRTYVSYDAKAMNSVPLYSSTGAINSEGGGFSVSVLSRQACDVLPASLSVQGRAAVEYMRILKVDSQNGVPYAVSDNFVSRTLYERFPPGSESVSKLSRLVRDYANPPLTGGFERVTVATVTEEEAGQLQVAVGSPVARVLRTFLGPEDEIAYAGLFTYGAQRFAIERDISHVLGIRPAKRDVRDSTS